MGAAVKSHKDKSILTLFGFCLLFFFCSISSDAQVPGTGTFAFWKKKTTTPVDCMGSPSPGDTCTGGAIYLGSLSPGAISGSGTDHYMTTPGGCNDSSTPTCSGTDSLTKAWYGSSGSYVDIPALVNYTTTTGTGNGAINLDQNYGSANTAAIVAHASISADSAADWCNNLVYGGYSDWHLPNRYELNLMWTNKNDIPGLHASTYYWSSTEYSGNNAWFQRFSDGYQGHNSKYSNRLVRCVRRYQAPDVTPDAMNWLDFDNESSVQTFTGINQTLSIELSASYGTGTPTIEYRLNGGSWVEFTPFTAASFSVSEGDDLEFQVSGAEGESATVTVTNLSDGNTVIDTVSGTVVSDPCLGSPSPGDTCTGGAIYLGSLSPGAISGSVTDHYMTTPGGCDDSATPTCSGTDSLTKAWRGSSGSSVDIPALVNYTTTTGTGNGAINLDQNYGSANTAAIVAHASISADSAAHFCDNLNYGGYTDWHLPNRYELNLFWTNKNDIPGLHASIYYWSSTEYDGKLAWDQRFSDGNQRNSNKIHYRLVRCVRRF